ncbi:hypothetical protein K2173_004188 [Erythroxylum novogranatense]|uniref:Monocopper oxidase-like protein SKU5 n=1 Tax=Erythroxylum novogranatense TaxID=1862640 RepID=A0AAV8SYF8_9ROSI|nr:hypothetical protein K2173_004188 [Erythroxylum novogranatense]
MVFHSKDRLLLRAVIGAILLLGVLQVSDSANISYDWHVAFNTTLKPASVQQPVIAINGMFPGPLINATTNDYVHVNVFNDLDEPLLFTWNGIQQRLNSWQDGVSGTNCAIQPGKNWTYVFEVKDQIGSFFYFPTTNFQKAGGGFGPIRVNNRVVISVPFAKPEADFDLLIGDCTPDKILMNGKYSYLDPEAGNGYESFTVTQGKTYRFRIVNVGSQWSFNFRIQGHKMLVVETEGSYTSQVEVDSLDVHVGQSYSALVSATQQTGAFYIVASAKMATEDELNNLTVVGVLLYSGSAANPTGQLPSGPDPFDVQFSINQAWNIKLNMTTGAARPNPQGSFNVWNVTLSQTFILRGSSADINGTPRYTVNNVSNMIPDTPLKLADYYSNGSGVYELDKFSTNSSNPEVVNGVFVATGYHKGWIEIIFQNDLDGIDTWHLDGFGFFVVGFGTGTWTPESRFTYNLKDPVVRSTTQVYPGGWTAVYAYLDNPGMWNLRSQILKNWFLGEELYVRVYDADPNPAKELPPPDNIILCGKYAPAPSPADPPPPSPVDPPSPSPVDPPAPSPKKSLATSKELACLLILLFYCFS